MSDGMFTHTIKSLWQDMPGGGDWHFVWAKAEEQTKKANAAGTQFCDHSGGVRNVTANVRLLAYLVIFLESMFDFSPPLARP